MFAKRLISRRVVAFPVRHGHNLKKNLYVEENAGLRENTYQTWEFTWRNSFELLKYFVIPTVIIVLGIDAEFNTRDAVMGIEQERGYLPPMDAVIRDRSFGQIIKDSVWRGKEPMDIVALLRSLFW